MKKYTTVKMMRQLLDNKEVTSEELIKDCFDKIADDDKREDKINGFINLMKKEALFYAREADRELFSNRASANKPFLGIPIAIKDLINVKGAPTTCASRILEQYTSIYDATVIEKLKKAGAIIIGKTNMDEFAMGSSNETSYFGIVRNPNNREYIPGGSSGGSAAVVSANFVPMSLGSDTGGSIRLPAGFCGITGLKPTYGRVSRYGLVAFASSFDQIGPMTNNIEDNALTMNVIAGYDKKDSTSMDIKVPNYLDNMDLTIKGKKIGIPKEYFAEGNNQEVDSAIRKCIKIFENLGCEIIDISLPHTEYGVSAYYIISNAEASSNLSRFDGVRYGFRSEQDNIINMYNETRAQGFQKEVKRRIMLGTYVLSEGYYDAYYKKAQKVRTLIKKDFEDAFKKVDIIVGPVSPTPAFKLGEKINDPLSMYLSDVYTVPINLAGVPALALPCGKTFEGLPIGIQLIGNYFEESKLYNFGKHLEDQLQD